MNKLKTKAEYINCYFNLQWQDKGIKGELPSE